MNASSQITAFLPCRSGSERVPHKNIRPIGQYKHGLIEIKLKQLTQTPSINEIVVSTNDEKIIEYVNTIKIDNLHIDERRDELCSSSTSTDELINYVPEIIEQGIVLWTHVTSPFADNAFYDAAINAYKQNETSHDSLMSVTKTQDFLWSKEGPINYDRTQEKWPRTQTLVPFYTINNAAFIAPIEIYKEQQDRIGQSPYLFETEQLTAFDIDWQEDFDIADKLLSSGGLT